jgi:hypothetical protein
MLSRELGIKECQCACLNYTSVRHTLDHLFSWQFNMCFNIFYTFIISFSLYTMFLPLPNKKILVSHILQLVILFVERRHSDTIVKIWICLILDIIYVCQIYFYFQFKEEFCQIFVNIPIWHVCNAWKWMDMLTAEPSTYDMCSLLGCTFIFILICVSLSVCLPVCPSYLIHSWD